VNVQEEAVRRLFDAALELASSSRPQDGSTAAYIFRFLLRLPSFRHVLETQRDGSEAATAAANNDDDDDNYYRYICLLLSYLLEFLFAG